MVGLLPDGADCNPRSVRAEAEFSGWIMVVVTKQGGIGNGRFGSVKCC